MGVMNDLKIGLVGCGGLGSAHAQQIATIPGVRLVAVCDYFEESAGRMAQKLEVQPDIYSDYNELFEREGLDGVIVATPNQTHKEVTLAAADAGVHVFCEKPMALSVPDCDAMIAATDRARVHLMIGYIRRFQPAFQEMKRRVDEGDVGRLRLAYGMKLLMGPPGGVQGWQKKRAFYGGLFSQYSHEMDLLTWMAGPVKSVQAVMNFGDDPENEIEENVHLSLEFSSGAVGSLACSRLFPLRRYEIAVSGTVGSLLVDDARGTGPVQRREIGEKESRLIEVPNHNAMRAELEHFFDSIRTGARPTVDGIAGRRTIEIAMAAEESVCAGTKVFLNQRDGAQEATGS